MAMILAHWLQVAEKVYYTYHIQDVIHVLHFSKEVYDLIKAWRSRKRKV